MNGAEANPGAELYVYYRVPVIACTAAAAEVDALHRQLTTRWVGLQARRLVRAEGGTDDITWMEVFRRDPGLPPDVLEGIRQAGAPWPSARIGPRHEECFLVRKETP